MLTERIVVPSRASQKEFAMQGSSGDISRLLPTSVRYRIINLLAWTLVISATVCGQQQATQPEENRSGTISGRVVNESGQPMAGATVYIRPAGGVLANRSATTNLEGNFQVKGLDPALYYLNASSPAYTSALPDPDLPVPTYRVGDSVRLELVRGGVITGTVTNAAGEPMVGVRVRAIMVRDQTGRPLRGRLQGLGERSTDDRGVYRIYGLGQGTFIVQAGGGGAQGSANVTDFDAPTYAPSSTRDSATEVQVRTGEETPVDIRYRGEQGHAVSGTVKTSGSSGASVTLAQAGEGTIPTNFGYQTPGARGFTIYGVADGEYQLIGQETMGSLAAPTTIPEIAISDPIKVFVKGADVTGIEVVPKPLATITGRFALEPSKLTDCQNKRRPLFSETLVSLIVDKKEAQNDAFGAIRLFSGSSTPDKEGTFTFRNVRPGGYALSPLFYARYWYLKSITLGASMPGRQPSAPRDVGRSWLAVKSADRLTGLTVTLAEGAASVRGQVTAGEDEKLESGLLVYLVPADRVIGDDPFRYFLAEVRGENTFALGNLPPGRYFVFAQKPQANSPTTIEKLRLPESAETRAKMRRAGEALKTEVEVKPCQNITDYKLLVKSQ